MWSLVAVVGVAGLMTVSGCSDDGSDGASERAEASAADAGTDMVRTLLRLSDARPGEVIALRAGPVTDEGRLTVEWIDRLEGTIRSVSVPDEGTATVEDVATLARVEVGTDGEQRGLLGHAVIDGVRYAAWTDRATDHLLVGEVQRLDDDAGFSGRIVWDAGGTAGGAVGGHLAATVDGLLVLGIGQLTDWAQDHGSGALLLLDPAGPPDQEPSVLSEGYINPFAFVVVGDEVWVADNAVGEDTERIGRAGPGGRDELARSDVDPRAPSAVVALPGGNYGVCGFLDGDLRSWTPTGDAGSDGSYGDSLGPCLTGATELDDGSIATATADGLVLLPPPG
jgi:hypothetical protein